MRCTAMTNPRLPTTTPEPTTHDHVGSSEVIRLFPTFLWKSRLRPELVARISAGTLARIDELMRGVATLEPGTCWQSSHGLHRDEALTELMGVIDREVRDVLVFLKADEAQCRVTGCWANVHAPGGFHAMHSHPNNFLSGVYYVKSQAGADTINFHDPRPQTAIMRPPATALTAYNTDQVVVQVAPGTLLLFPAWLPHSVDRNCSTGQRISVSFNVMFDNYAQRMSEPLWGEP